MDVPLEPLQAGVGVFSTADRVLIPEAGLALDPISGVWSTVTECRGAGAGGVWTGRILLGVTAAYDPVEDHCRDVPLGPARGEPFQGTRGREFPVAVWSGRELITWSGGTGGDSFIVPSDGAAFRPEF